MTTTRIVMLRAAAGLVGAASIVALPVATVSGVANADPGIGWGAPGPGILRIASTWAVIRVSGETRCSFDA